MSGCGDSANKARRLRVGLVLGLLALGARAESTQTDPTLGEVLGGGSVAGFERALQPRAFRFPLDHGAHPGYKHEWWYFTGNLGDAQGRDFGFQLTLFRIALTPDAQARESRWAADQVYMGHLAIADIDARRFYHFQRFSRAAIGLAGSAVEDSASAPGFRVWLQDWTVVQEPAGAADCARRWERSRCLAVRIDAHQDGVGLALELASVKPVVLQGEQGLSQKSAQAGNASYYYSFPRMAATGTLRVGGEPFAVDGLAWMDREWSTSVLGEGQVGWDWFSLQLDDGSELMWYHMRRADGTLDPHSQGVYVTRSGSSRRLRLADVSLEVLAHWQSPHTGVRYPAGWRLRERGGDISLEIWPRQADQELHETVMKYWEGAVSVQGSIEGMPVQGGGYVELAGYR